MQILIEINIYIEKIKKFLKTKNKKQRKKNQKHKLLPDVTLN